MRGVFYFYIMHNFLQDVVKRVSDSKIPFSEYTFILPNKRSALFLKKEISSFHNADIISPKIFEIDEFMQYISGLEKIEDSELYFDFYKCYLENNSKEDEIQSFDEFISWAKLMLVDFNEIDRELCETQKLFDYVNAFKDLNHWSFEEKENELLKKYILFWRNLKPYYNSLTKKLLTKKRGYQGKIYREATRSIKEFIKKNNIVNHIFLGFNALSKSESYIIQSIIEQNQSNLIFWDIDKTLINSDFNNSSFFIKYYFKNWNYYKSNKKEFVSDEYQKEKDISVLGSAKSITQLKYVGSLIQKMSKEEQNKTAIILADENLLIPMLNSLPSTLGNVNVTMGYPIENTTTNSLFKSLFKLHYSKRKEFYYKDIISIIQNELLDSFFDENVNILELVKKNNLIYISAKDLTELDKQNEKLYNLLFAQWGTPKVAIKNCLSLIKEIKEELKNKDKIRANLIYHIETIFLQLENYTKVYDFIRSVKSLDFIYTELLKSCKSPFQSPNNEGIQIMGMLETRLLNFENIFIISMNEGILPKGKINNSYIPFEVKKKFGLQTHFEKDAIFSYHFFRLIKNARKVIISYNTEPDMKGGGEISRFVRQIEAEGIHKINFQTIDSKKKISVKTRDYDKTDLVLNKLDQILGQGITASMLNLFLIDKKKFFERYVLEIRDDNIEEIAKANTLGNVVHDTIEQLYTPLLNKKLNVKELKEIKKTVRKTVRKRIEKYINKKSLERGKNIIITNTAINYVKKLIEKDIHSCNKGNKIKILEVEKNFTNEIASGKRTIKIRGKIDRIDLYNGKIRMVDYKTGKLIEKNKINIRSLKEIKNENGIYALQLLLYAIGIREKYKKDIYGEIVSSRDRINNKNILQIEGERYLNNSIIDQGKKYILEIIEEIKNKDEKF
jgi:ATP-dependent helicase/nuclease subunit B